MEANYKINVTIVGNSLIFRNGLKMLIENEKTFKVIDEAANLTEALAAIGKYKPDVLLVDSSEIENTDAETFFAECCDEIATLILTNSTDPVQHQNYLLLGVNGVVTKEQGAEVLFKAIKKVHSSDLWFNRDIIKQTIERLLKEKEEAPHNPYTKNFFALTQREREVLVSICKGMKNKVIAESLFISETTVRHHLTSIFEKLNVKSRLALAILAFNEGLVEVPAKNDHSSTAKFH